MSAGTRTSSYELELTCYGAVSYQSIARATTGFDQQRAVHQTWLVAEASSDSNTVLRDHWDWRTCQNSCTHTQITEMLASSIFNIFSLVAYLASIKVSVYS